LIVGGCLQLAQFIPLIVDLWVDTMLLTTSMPIAWILFVFLLATRARIEVYNQSINPKNNIYANH
ncbi:hypothetical protein, partial [Parabacteroides sp.]